MKMQELEKMTNDYAKCFSALRDDVEALNWEIEEIKNKHLGAIREKVNLAKSAESKLKKSIVECEACFNKPKTLVLHGIKIGFQKKKGTINFADNSIDLIKSKLQKHEPALLITKQSISKTYAQRLSVAEIKSIGGEVVADKDEIVIKSVDSNVDKLVNQLLKSDQDVKL